MQVTYLKSGLQRSNRLEALNAFSKDRKELRGEILKKDLWDVPHNTCVKTMCQQRVCMYEGCLEGKYIYQGDAAYGIDNICAIPVRSSIVKSFEVGEGTRLYPFR